MKSEPSACHKLLSILWLLEQDCLPTKECQVFELCPPTSSSRQFENILWTIDSPTVSSASFLKWWSSKQGLETLKSCLSLFVPVHNIFQRTFFAWPSLSYDRATAFALRFLPILVIVSWFWRTSWFEHVSELFNDTFVRFAFTLSASQIFVVKKGCWFSKFDKFHQFLQHGAMLCFLPAILISSTYTDKNNLCFRERTDIPNAELFPSQERPNRTSSNCHSQKRPANGCPYKFRSRGTTGSSMFDHEFGHFWVVEDGSNKSGHSDYGFLRSFGASSILVLVSRYHTGWLSCTTR